MSSSDAPRKPGATGDADPSRWGRVFMGPDVSRESSIDKLLNAQERDLWNRSTEIEYLKRVRERAAAEAQAILEKAQERADKMHAAAETWAEDVKERMQALYAEAQNERNAARAAYAEADAIRSTAHENGFHTGLGEAEQTIAAHEQQRDAAVSAILRRIQQQCGVIFEAWRGELTALSRQAVETATGWVMTEERAAVFAQMLADAVAAMEQHQVVTAKVNPQDADVLADLLRQTHEQLGLQTWRVEADPVVEPGGLVLETDTGRVDNLPSMRRVVVEEALTRLGVPYSSADQAAVAAVRAPCPELDVLPTAPPPPAPEPEDVFSVAAPLPDMDISADPEAFSVTESLAEEASFLAPPTQPEPAFAAAPEAMPLGEEPAGLEIDMTLSPTPEPEQEAPETLPDVLVDDAQDKTFSQEELDDFFSADEAMPDAERQAMEMAAAAMDKALGEHGGLPDDVAAYIMDAVAGPGSVTPLSEEPSLLADPAEPASESLAPEDLGASDGLELTDEPEPAEFVDALPEAEPAVPEDAAPAEDASKKEDKPKDRNFDSLMNMRIADDGSKTSLNDLQDISALLGDL